MSTTKPESVRATLAEVLGRNVTVRPTADGLTAETPAVVGVEARELNRRLFSAVRSADDAARLHTEWTADGVCERFRGYVFVKERGS